MHVIVSKNWLLKVEDLCYEFSTNDVVIFRIICPEVIYKIDFLKDSLKFTGKQQHWRLFFQ